MSQRDLITYQPVIAQGVSRHDAAETLAELAMKMAEAHGFDARELLDRAALSLGQPPAYETPLATLMRFTRV